MGHGDAEGFAHGAGGRGVGGGAFGGVKAVGTRPWVENLDGVLDVAGGGGEVGGFAAGPRPAPLAAVFAGLLEALSGSSRRSPWPRPSPRGCREALAMALVFAVAPRPS